MVISSLDRYIDRCQDFFDDLRRMVSFENSRNRFKIAPVLNASFILGLNYCDAVGIDLAYSKSN